MECKAHFRAPPIPVIAPFHVPLPCTPFSTCHSHVRSTDRFSDLKDGLLGLVVELCLPLLEFLADDTVTPHQRPVTADNHTKLSQISTQIFINDREVSEKILTSTATSKVKHVHKCGAQT